MSQLPTDWRTCAADLFKHHEPVLHRLAKKNPTVDREDLHDAFLKAILQTATHPEKFDALRETKIEDFLVGASKRSLLQILRSHRRRIRREEINGKVVANDRPAARPIVEGVADSEIALRAREVAKTDEERNVLRLWELGYTDAEIEQELSMAPEKVRRIRDRVTKRLRRLGQHFSDE